MRATRVAPPDSFAPATQVVAGVTLAAALVAAAVAVPLALPPLAVFLGWSHLSSV